MQLRLRLMVQLTIHQCGLQHPVSSTDLTDSDCKEESIKSIEIIEINC